MFPYPGFGHSPIITEPITVAKREGEGICWLAQPGGPGKDGKGGGGKGTTPEPHREGKSPPGKVGLPLQEHRGMGAGQAESELHTTLPLSSRRPTSQPTLS